MMKPLIQFVLTLVLIIFSLKSVDAADSSSLQLNITNTVNDETTFKIFRRRAADNSWDTGSAFASTNGMHLLNALENSKKWDGKSHAAAYGMLHAYTPGIEFTIDWSQSQKERQAHSISLCYGNRLFWYGNSVYQVPENSYGLVDRLFPKDKSEKSKP